MQIIGILALPSIVAVIIIFGLIKKVDVFDVFVAGAKEGMATSVKIFPSLIGLMMAVCMVKSSGIIDILTHSLTTFAQMINFPVDVLPLALLRPVSGGGSIALYNEILKDTGADSFASRVASVFAGSSDTTFYAISIYYGSIGVKKFRQTLPVALIADFSSLVFSVILVNLFF